MDPTPLTTLAGGVVIAVLAASAALWLWIGKRWLRGQALLDDEPRRRVPWSGWQLLAIFLAYLLLHFGFSRVAQDWARSGPNRPAASSVVPPEQRTKPHVADGAKAEAGDEPAASHRPLTIPEMKAALLANAMVNVLFGLAVVAVLCFGRAGASWADLGLPLTRLAYDIRAGVIGFFVAVVPVQLLNTLLSAFWPGEHPIVTFLSKTTEVSGVLIATGAAVAVAPLIEELLFRVVLQGWLESNEPHADAAQFMPDGRAPIAWRPIILSSAIFALLHFGHGPAPIPLFLLALVLGFLYQRTHRIWASVTLHFLFNLSSLLALWVTLSSKGHGLAP
ncbi:MAG TPA: CPBP family intramembrane glutamic endopeptidase [Pirellulales bacterium]|jgi:membrane protease YdiL (CAAX protease family)|nr:CPBP family intramembrane glutamic endopeptidase [Pirellulales bacterium]